VTDKQRGQQPAQSDTFAQNRHQTITQEVRAIPEEVTEVMLVML
jgi:hypothetical protein